jgi:abnormal spindle-like microcephaly-associated protein
VSRATKLHNVQIALDALFGERGVGSIVKDVSAEDIVDGYREKTIGLLWGLVGKFGLSGLVDWGDVKKEIIRLRRKAASQIGEQECGNDEPSGDDLNTEYKKHIFLLRQWASILSSEACD